MKLDDRHYMTHCLVCKMMLCAGCTGTNCKCDATKVTTPEGNVRTVVKGVSNELSPTKAGPPPSKPPNWMADEEKALKTSKPAVLADDIGGCQLEIVDDKLVRLPNDAVAGTLAVADEEGKKKKKKNKKKKVRKKK